MYSEDTLFHLSPLGQSGVVVIALGLAAATLWGTWRLTRHWRWPVRLLAAMGMVVIYEWLHPQVFYLWYLVVIDGLPLQWVIGALPDPSSGWRVLAFEERASLSAHGRGVLGWMCILLALARPCARDIRYRSVL